MTGIGEKKILPIQEPGRPALPIINNLLDPIKQDPRYREIVPIGSGNYLAQWFTTMAKRPEVAFVTPKTRAIAASMKIRILDGNVGKIIDVEMIPTAQGDPALGRDLPAPANAGEVILSASAADRLAATVGVTLEGIVSRTQAGQLQTELVPLKLIGVAPVGAFSRNGLFVSTDLLVGVEDFRDGQSFMKLDQAGSGESISEREFTGFRLYADEIDDVEKLRAELAAQGIEVRTKAADIELVKSLDLNLSIVYWVIALVSLAGFCFSFGASLWANIDRKKREYSVLRMIGFRTRGIIWFPMLQAMMTGVLGWLLAVVAYFVVQEGLNAMFMDNLGAGNPVCRLLPLHVVLALVLTLVAASFAAILGGYRVARVEPSAGLRSS